MDAQPLFAANPPRPTNTPLPQATVLWNTLPTLTPRKPGQQDAPEQSDGASAVLQALQEAEAIREQARKEAVSIVQAAKDEAKNLHQDTFVEAYAGGLTEARREVAEELTARFDERCEALGADVQGLIDAILQERMEMWSAMEGEITTLALEIARKVIKIEVTQNDTVIYGVVKDALRRVTDRDNLRILVNLDEIQQVRGNREDLLVAIDGVDNLEIDGDRRVGRGGCMIETNAGSIDAKLETQLEQVQAAMKG